MGSAARTTGVEREVKLGAWAGMALPDLVEVVPGAGATSLPSQRLTATYYDTPDLRLARWGVTVRYRTVETAGAPDPEAELDWTVKLPAPDAPQGGLSRQEVGFAGGERRVPAPVASLVRGMTRAAVLGPVARLRTDRLRLELHAEDGSPLAEIDDDEVSVLVGRRLMSRFRELEVELAPGADAAVLDAVVSRLRSAGAGRPDPTPKAIRALGPRALEPPEVVVPALSRDATAAAAVTAAVAANVTRLLRHDAGVRLGDDPEDVHQARVATRRLRSDLRTLRPLLDEAWAGALRVELGWIAGLLGDVRDADVLHERLERQAARLPAADAKAAGGLLRRLEDQREVAGQALRSALDSPRYLSLLDTSVDAAQAPVFAGTGEEERRAADVLPGLVRRPWRHLQRAVGELGDQPADEALHQVRIRAKRCRYAAEAAAAVMGRPAVRLGEAVAELQTILGEFHDAIVAEQWLRQAAMRGPVSQALAAGQLVAAEREEADAGRRAWRGAWKRASAKRLRSWLDPA